MCGDTRMHDLSLRGEMCVCSGGGWREWGRVEGGGSRKKSEVPKGQNSLL